MGTGHARSILAGLVPNCELAAVYDRPDVVSNDFAGLPYFEDPVALMRSGLVNAVCICTPHYSHATLGIAALKAGLHVMVEKPISVHKADALKLLAAHRRDDQVFAAMFNQRTDPISLVSGYKSNNSIWLKFPASGFLNSLFISSSCKAIFSNG
jgi:predicted dehydrogenase